MKMLKPTGGEEKEHYARPRLATVVSVAVLLRFSWGIANARIAVCGANETCH